MKKFLRKCAGWLAFLASCGQAETVPGAAQDPVRERGSDLTSFQVADLEFAIDRRFRRFMDDNQLPGGVVVVVHEGQTLFANGYGLANVEQQIAVDPDRTRFRIKRVLL